MTDDIELDALEIRIVHFMSLRNEKGVFRVRSVSAFSVAEVNILLDPSSADVTKNWILRSLDDDKLSGVTLKVLEEFYSDILYGKYGKWTNDEVCALCCIEKSFDSCVHVVNIHDKRNHFS